MERAGRGRLPGIMILLGQLWGYEKVRMGLGINHFGITRASFATTMTNLCLDFSYSTVPMAILLADWYYLVSLGFLYSTSIDHSGFLPRVVQTNHPVWVEWETLIRECVKEIMPLKRISVVLFQPKGGSLKQGSLNFPFKSCSIYWWYPGKRSSSTFGGSLHGSDSLSKKLAHPRKRSAASFRMKVLDETEARAKLLSGATHEA